MSVFDLRTSPFYLLGISPRDSRAAIAEATETAVQDGHLEETVATRAQQILMSPRLRLDAELAWLPGVAPNRAKKLIEDANLDLDTASGLPLVAGANIAAHRCAVRLLPTRHDLLLRFYANRAQADILNLLNAERKASGFPEITSELLEDALKQLLLKHTLSLVHLILGEPEPGVFLLNILDRNFRDSGEIIEFLDNLVEQFDNHAAAPLGAAENTISACLDSIQADPASLDQRLPAFSNAIADWSSVAAPRQYILARRHLKDPRTERLLSRIRGVCLHVHNELGDASTPLALTKAALPAFTHSAEHLELIRADIRTLEERVSTQAVLKIAEPLHSFITDLSSKHSALCTSLRRGDFKKGGRGIAGDLYRHFEKSALDLAGKTGSDIPFRMILSLAVIYITRAMLVVKHLF